MSRHLAVCISTAVVALGWFAAIVGAASLFGWTIFNFVSFIMKYF